jgi:hypothetical protein
MNTGGEQQKHWLVRPSTIRMLWIIGLIILALLVIGDALVHGHPAFAIDGSFAFYAWYGLIGCLAMILAAKGLGAFLKRKDTYYDD